MSTPTHRKHYIPLESNPEVFTHLINALGVYSLEFQDVLSIDEPDLLAIVPRPVLGLILVFPTSEAYETQIAEEEAVRKEYTGSGDGEDVIWYKQTINNACGLYGILHAVSNGKARSFIGESIPSCHYDGLVVIVLQYVSFSTGIRLVILILLGRTRITSCKAPRHLCALGTP